MHIFSKKLFFFFFYKFFKIYHELEKNIAFNFCLMIVIIFKTNDLHFLVVVVKYSIELIVFVEKINTILLVWLCDIYFINF